MEHEEAVQFVSAVFDAQNVPAEAARHIQNCLTCQGRLHDYEEMRIELRLSASASDMGGQDEPWTVPPRPLRSRWIQRWRTRVSIPGPAFALGVALIVALSVGLGYLRAQGGRQVFHFEISSPQARGSNWGANLEVGGKAGYGMPGPKGDVRALFQLLEIRDGVARLTVRARRFDRSTSEEVEKRSLDEAPAREYQYVPGETLNIPVNDWGTLSLKGEVLDRAEKFSWENPSIEPWPNQIVLKAPVLVRGKELVFQDATYAADATGPDPSASFYVPGEGRFVFRLQPFNGAVAGLADFGHVRFDLDGQKYLLACATPVTGGPQPRQIWVYLDRGYHPSQGEIGSGSSD
jgi:hypothetical protein